MYIAAYPCRGGWASGWVEGDKVATIESALDARKAGPGTHRIVGEPQGFYLKVDETTGNGSFFLRFRLAGKRRELGLGRLARDITKSDLDDVREAAGAAAKLVKAGTDPIEERKRVRLEAIAAAKAAKPSTFDAMVDGFLEAHGPGWRHRRAIISWRRSIEMYASPVIGRLMLDEIQIPHILDIMQRAEKAGSPTVALRVRARVEQVLNRAIALSGKAIRNPADIKLIAAARPMGSKGEPEHFRAVELEAAPAIFRAPLEASKGRRPVLAVWCFMILCAVRPGEALWAKWSEIDLARKLWTLPAERTKRFRKHIIPLSTLALEILERQAQIRTGDTVFRGAGGSPFAYDTFAQGPARTKPPIDAANAHGWRSVFRDYTGEIGHMPRELAEFALAHGLPKTEAAYRRLTAVEKRREHMEKYAQWLMSEEAGAEVIDLEEQRRRRP
jgi:integrase